MAIITVGAGGDFTTINAATAAATAGDTIQIFAGTYTANVVVNKSLTLIGAGDSTIIEGTFRTDNAIPGGQTVGEFLQTAASYLANAGAGITVSANDVTLQDLQVRYFNTAVELGSNSVLSIRTSRSRTSRSPTWGTATAATRPRTSLAAPSRSSGGATTRRATPRLPPRSTTSPSRTARSTAPAPASAPASRAS